MDFKGKNGTNHKIVAQGTLWEEKKNLCEKNECKYDSYKIYNTHIHTDVWTDR